MTAGASDGQEAWYLHGLETCSMALQCGCRFKHAALVLCPGLMLTTVALQPGSLTAVAARLPDRYV